jgi:SnoaL-like protein
VSKRVLFTKSAKNVTVMMHPPAPDTTRRQTVDPGDLVDIEALKQLKARYCRLLDGKDWAAWRQLFTDDFVSDTSKAGGRVIEGADDFVAFTRRSLQKPSQVTAHQVHAPELELTSPAAARGIWALEDVVRLAPGITLRGYGHYHETYAKVDGRWLIESSTLTRLREDVFNVVVSIYVSERMKKVGAKMARRWIS